MKEINITEKDYKALNAKMYEIWKIPKWNGNGIYWQGVQIEVANEKVFIYGVSLGYGGSTAYNQKFYFKVSLDDLDKPIAYFEKKYADEIDKYKKLFDEEKKKEAEEKMKQEEITERKEYERLRAKFEA